MRRRGVLLYVGSWSWIHTYCCVIVVITKFLWLEMASYRIMIYSN